MGASSAPGPSAADIEAARMLLDRLGVSPADLPHAPSPRQQVPTFAEYVPVVAAAVSAGTRRVYGSYWNRALRWWADRRIDELSASEIKHLADHVKTHTVARRNGRGPMAGVDAEPRRT